MKTIFPLAALALLAACSESAPEPAETPAAAPTEEVESLGPPSEDTFKTAFAEACPNAETVASAICESKGIGSDEFVCEYGLGDTEYRGLEADLKEGEEKWVLADPETVCAQGAE